ncbi:MAG: MliC family protein [Devosia sp.]|uniref:MliC family protein n=1 Tax=Devosia sp. TaxID=1871048 RepID=UPI0024CCBB6F|nr:MliC family protein [Devosia sp.]UYO00829.1 MAG: MliC family protein [Devosia sp.]
MPVTQKFFAALMLAAASPALGQEEVATPPASPAPATATASLTITLDSAGDVERNIVTYQCEDGQVLAVQYINAAPNFLAILPVDGENHIFATTISASGARYVSGPYEWWSHQGEGTLRDLMQDEDAAPLASCVGANNTP